MITISKAKDYVQFLLLLGLLLTFVLSHLLGLNKCLFLKLQGTIISNWLAIAILILMWLSFLFIVYFINIFFQYRKLKKIDLNNFDFLQEYGVYQHKKTNIYYCPICLSNNKLRPMVNIRTILQCTVKDCRFNCQTPGYEHPIDNIEL